MRQFKQIALNFIIVALILLTGCQNIYSYIGDSALNSESSSEIGQFNFKTKDEQLDSIEFGANISVKSVDGKKTSYKYMQTYRGQPMEFIYSIKSTASIDCNVALIAVTNGFLQPFMVDTQASPSLTYTFNMKSNEEKDIPLIMDMEHLELNKKSYTLLIAIFYNKNQNNDDQVNIYGISCEYAFFVTSEKTSASSPHSKNDILSLDNLDFTQNAVPNFKDLININGFSSTTYEKEIKDLPEEDRFVGSTIFLDLSDKQKHFYYRCCRAKDTYRTFFLSNNGIIKAFDDKTYLEWESSDPSKFYEIKLPVNILSKNTEFIYAITVPTSAENIDITDIVASVSEICLTKW